MGKVMVTGRPARHAAPPRRSGSSGGNIPWSKIAAYLARRQTVGVLAIGAAILGALSLFFPRLTVFGLRGDTLTGFFGWGAPLVLSILGLAGGVLTRPDLRGWLWLRRRQLSSAALFVAAVWGVGGTLSPAAAGVVGQVALGPLLVFPGQAVSFLLFSTLAIVFALLAGGVPGERIYEAIRRGVLLAVYAIALAHRRLAARRRPLEPILPRSQPAAAGRAPRAVADSHRSSPAPRSRARPEPAEPAPRPSTAGGWQLPPIDLLELPNEADLNDKDVRHKAQQIEETLLHFGVPAKVVEINQGPAVTQFGVEPGFDVKVRDVKDREGHVIRTEELSRIKVKVARITGLANDLALALSAPTIRIEAPVPGKSVVGIEVPNTSVSVVALRSVLESDAFARVAGRSKLALALGKDVEGEPVVADLAKMPHLLIAGSTGSGKSVFLNSIVTTLLMNTAPVDVRLLMVDPKRVELVGYNGVPHLLSSVVVDLEKVVGVLKWVVGEMENRYRKFSQAGARNIEVYNRRPLPGEDRLPYLVLIIDELADLMMMAPDDVERLLCRLAQMARATGIHLVIATQRPSVDVITGLIKANFPTRVSFAVTSQVDSRTILDAVGAEKLLGRGDMLYLPPDAPKPARLQGVYLSDDEIERVVDYWKRAYPAQYVEEIENLPAEAEADSRDPLLEEARELLAQHGQVSISFLQRRLRVGYNRAARLMEELSAELKAEPAESSGEEAEVASEDHPLDAAGNDPLLEEVRRLMAQHGPLSAQSLQRRFGIGYDRAARLVQALRG